MNAHESTCHPGDGAKVLNRLPYLAEPLLRFDLQGELQELRREDSWGRETGHSSKTLAKYPDFRIVLVLMKAATHMDEHRAEARISIQALVGRIRLHLRGQKPLEFSAGQLLALDCGMPHDVEAFNTGAHKHSPHARHHGGRAGNERGRYPNVRIWRLLKRAARCRRTVART